MLSADDLAIRHRLDASLAMNLAGLFDQPIAVRVTGRTEPYQEIAPGVRLGFKKPAEVRLTLERKTDRARSRRSDRYSRGVRAAE